MSDGLLDTTAGLARAFVDEYLKRTPEYIDVVEFVDENIGDEDAIDDDLLADVFKRVVDMLDVVAQRFEDDE